MTWNSFFSIVQTIFVLGLVILLANLSLKFLKNQMSKQNKIIRIIERVSINTNSALAVVEIGEKYYLMSFTNNENTILKELDGENIDELIHQKHFGMGKEVD